VWDAWNTVIFDDYKIATKNRPILFSVATYKPMKLSPSNGQIIFGGFYKNNR
jgi:hypothetical protein